MKSTDHLDKLAVKVQQTLFQYFYSHNRVCWDGTFSPPRDVRKMAGSDCSRFDLLNNAAQKSANSPGVARLGGQHKIHKIRVRPASGL